MGILAALGIGGTAGLALPGGSTVFVPAPWTPIPLDDRRCVETGTLVAYRRYHSTMAGTNECNGLIAVGNAMRFNDLAAFVRDSRGALTTRWSYADESEGHWYGKETERYPVTDGEGPNGPERVGVLKVHSVGWTVYDDPACLYAVADKRGVMIAIWIRNRDGGERRARAVAERIAASFKV